MPHYHSKTWFPWECKPRTSSKLLILSLWVFEYLIFMAQFPEPVSLVTRTSLCLFPDWRHNARHLWFFILWSSLRPNGGAPVALGSRSCIVEDCSWSDSQNCPLDSLFIVSYSTQSSINSLVVLTLTQSH